jgi:hypothetical protein
MPNWPSCAPTGARTEAALVTMCDHARLQSKVYAHQLVELGLWRGYPLPSLT